MLHGVTVRLRVHVGHFVRTHCLQTSLHSIRLRKLDRLFDGKTSTCDRRSTVFWTCQHKKNTILPPGTLPAINLFITIKWNSSSVQTGRRENKQEIRCYYSDHCDAASSSIFCFILYCSMAGAQSKGVSPAQQVCSMIQHKHMHIKLSPISVKYNFDD
jgi:hypothetical protein